MKKHARHFTLVEMLTVVAIIGILAGLIIPTVVISQNKGRVTQAKTDISSITTALKQLKTDYGRILVEESSKYYAGAAEASSTTFKYKPDGSNEKEFTVAGLTGNSYNAFIAELSVPKNQKLTDTGVNKKHCINRRRKVYLDPKSGFDPSKAYDDAANLDKLYRDPWGTPYAIYVSTETSLAIQVPGNAKITAAETAVYSFGPNGTDDKGCNVELDACQYTADSGNHKNHDDIASWNL